MKERMNQSREKLGSERGIALIFVVLIAAIAAVSISIIFLGYQQHLKNSRRLFDEVTVSTAERVARETYILDLKSGGITYYYDEIHRTVTDASTFEGKVPIPGYGRSYASENKRGETGAIGIPNRGKDGGAQFLAVSVESDGRIHSRWQGPWLTAEDYELMTTAERERLTIDQLNQIDSSLIYELGKTKQMTEPGKNAASTESEQKAASTESEQETAPKKEKQETAPKKSKQATASAKS